MALFTKGKWIEMESIKDGELFSKIISYKSDFSRIITKQINKVKVLSQSNNAKEIILSAINEKMDCGSSMNILKHMKINIAINITNLAMTSLFQISSQEVCNNT